VSALQLLNNYGLGAINDLSQAITIEGPTASAWLKAMLSTGRCFWRENMSKAIQFAASVTPSLQWQLLANGHQKFKACIDDTDVSIFFLDQLWFFHAPTCSMGLTGFKAPAGMISTLLKAPEVPPEAAKQLADHIHKVCAEPALLPQVLPAPKRVKVDKITPEVRLDIKKLRLPKYIAQDLIELNPFLGRVSNLESLVEVSVPTVEIVFDYGFKIISFSRQLPQQSVNFVEDGKIYTFDRDFAKEKECLSRLADHVQLIEYDKKSFQSKSQPSSNQNSTTNNSTIQPPEIAIITSLKDEMDFFDFSVQTIPALERNGWRVVRQHAVFLELYCDDDLSWYSELNEESEYDYFSFSMGILIDDQKINVLPLIAKMMASTNINEFANLADEEQVPVPLDDGAVLMVSYARIKPILNILIELYDSELSSSDAIKISKRQAALLFEIDKAFTASQLRWFGGDKLLKLGKQLQQFKSLKNVNPPKTFKATLRSYQKDGVNWLQFLREYQLGGILADDMGLGKTVQTLAHLSIEKNKRRMTKPSLLIAPTSLMYNWKRESSQFTPNLKVLIHHGEQRHLNIERFNEYDLVLTTYPLIIRDKRTLLAYEFYYLILDEAQYIKNHRTKSTQIVQQLTAEHRLCLTGTPMENHLGELWSIFHFVMPGFLGDAQQFNRIFRAPIEKQADSAKQKSLSSRINPFMLRRQKSEVLNDLPEKTEIIQTVELQGPQRDLYESIRLAMEKKVRQAIQNKGLSRSHIIILDALLKLRQVCCDPRLLTLTSATKAHGYSAKMAMLMDMLPNMVEEGRKILVFSQFTKMLGLIETSLQEKGLPYAKLTGTTRDRQTPVETFQSGKVPLFLISLKAGGTGLNLTAADTVIHYDPWWNPAVESQATDRAHRYGQQKSVFVYKLQAAGTVEETIQEMQHKKAGLMAGLFSEKKTGKLALSSNDLQSLFKSM